MAENDESGKNESVKVTVLIPKDMSDKLNELVDKGAYKNLKTKTPPVARRGFCYSIKPVILIRRDRP